MADQAAHQGRGQAARFGARPITPKCGAFMWPRPSRWPITTGLCSAMADAGLQAVSGPEEKGSLRPEKEKTAYVP